MALDAYGMSERLQPFVTKNNKICYIRVSEVNFVSEHYDDPTNIGLKYRYVSVGGGSVEIQDIEENMKRLGVKI